MSLHITKKDSVYELIGNLSADQVFELGRYFNLKLHEEKVLKISLANLDSVDVSSALMFKQLLSQAQMRNKECIIFGLKNRKILGAFRRTEMVQELSA